MNKLVKSLSEQAKLSVPHGTLGPEQWLEVYHDSFAKLIVKECVLLCDKAVEENGKTLNEMTETKELDSMLVARGAQVQAEKLSRNIKKHFEME